MTTESSLKALTDAKKLKEEFKGMDENDIILLIEQFGLTEAKLYNKMRKPKKDTIYTFSKGEVILTRAFIGTRPEVGKGAFAMSGHSLYSLLRELNLKPSEFYAKLKDK